MRKFYDKKIAMGVVAVGLLAALIPTYGLAKSNRQHSGEAMPAAADQIKLPQENKITQLLNELRQSREKSAVPARAAGNDSILGTPVATKEQCVNYLLSVNPAPHIKVAPAELVEYYYEEGRREGVRPDVAFAQALKETGFFRYGGTVTPEQNNYCGLGTTSTRVKGAYFESPQLGVRAHIQHLLAYASTRRPVEPVVDPRYDLVRSVYSSSTVDTWEGLNGRWAVPGKTYGESILQIHENILRK